MLEKLNIEQEEEKLTENDIIWVQIIDILDIASNDISELYRNKYISKPRMRIIMSESYKKIQKLLI